MVKQPFWKTTSFPDCPSDTMSQSTVIPTLSQRYVSSL
jgi:hypothetical protein